MSVGLYVHQRQKQATASGLIIRHARRTSLQRSFRIQLSLPIAAKPRDLSLLHSAFSSLFLNYSIHLHSLLS